MLRSRFGGSRRDRHVVVLSFIPEGIVLLFLRYRTKIHRRSLRLRRRGTPLLLGSDAPGLAHFRSLGALPSFQILLGSRHHGVVVVCNEACRRSAPFSPHTRRRRMDLPAGYVVALPCAELRRTLARISRFSSCLHLTKEALAGDGCQPRDECQPGDGRPAASLGIAAVGRNRWQHPAGRDPAFPPIPPSLG